MLRLTADPAVSLSHPLLVAPATGGRLDDSNGGTALRTLDGFTINMGSSSPSDIRYVSALVKGSALIQFEGTSGSNSFVRSALGVDQSGKFLVGNYNEIGKYATKSSYSNGAYQADKIYLLVAKITPSAAAAAAGRPCGAIL